jgi:L,D-peptidoglycan transpeptidase YkuD (ErfK/YbiS/YcfS/YnhG family)
VPRTAAVAGLNAASACGTVRLGGLTWPCALGRGGRSTRKREGDGATPVGCWRVAAVLYRPDRVRRPPTRLPLRRIRPGDGWCDDPADRNYNRAVQHPYPASAERLWRADHLYDVVVLLAHNWRPRMRGRGSAIFMHLARPGNQPTAGCVALSREHLLRLVQRLAPGARVRVLP